jgi:hypothetical protein
MEVTIGNIANAVPPLLQAVVILLKEWRESREREKAKRLDPGTESQPPIR